jgi:hypothetical protein
VAPPDGCSPPESSRERQIHGQDHEPERDHPEAQDGQEPNEAGEYENNAKGNPQRPRLRQPDLPSGKANVPPGHGRHTLIWKSAAEFIFNVDVDDVLKAVLGPKAEAFGAASIEAAWPALDDPHDVRIGFVSNSRDIAFPGYTPQSIDLLRNGDRHARHGQIAPGADLSRIKRCRMHQEAYRRARRCMGMAHIHRHGQNDLLAVQGLPDDA